MKFHAKAFVIMLFLLAPVWAIAAEDNDMHTNTQDSSKMLVRIAEIKIKSDSLNDYMSILKQGGETAVKMEPGVIAIFPMVQKDDPSEIRILEIYASRIDYEAHLQTAHFKEYKTKTLNMIESLKLIDMEAMDDKSLPAIFKRYAAEF